MKNKKGEIKLIAFDVGGVLQLGRFSFRKLKRHESFSTHQYIAKKLNIDIDSWFDSLDTPYAESIEGKIPRKKAISIIAKNLKISSERLTQLFHKAYKYGFKKNKKLYKIAYKLKKKGYKIGILSDQWYLSADVLTSKKDMKGFNPVVISCFEGVRKPNPKIYKLLVKKSKVKAKEILFIDNRDWNLKPARKLGMKTILFKNNNQCIRDLKKLGLL